MVCMTTTNYTEELHPRRGDGKYAKKSNSAPEPGSLNDNTAPNLGAQLRDAADAWDRALEGGSGDAEISAGAELADLARSAAAQINAAGPTRLSSGKTVQETVYGVDDLTDFTVMGGDEIRALTPKQRSAALAQALKIAERLQAYRDELDDPIDDSTEHLGIIDYNNITEKQASDVWTAAGQQLGGVGTFRTVGDAVAAIQDEHDLTDEQIRQVERLWRDKYRDAYEQDEFTSQSEWDTWQEQLDGIRTELGLV